MLSVCQRLAIAVVISAGLSVSCADPTVAPTNPSLGPRLAKSSTTGPTVKATTPSSAPQNVTLDVQITGTGFVDGSNAQWLLNGQTDPRVRTNSTRFVSSTSLVANITITEDAVPTTYDVEVITPQGKKGIGTEAFTVQPMVELSAPDGISRANDINESALIVGNRSGGCNGAVLPVIWTPDGSISDLPLPAEFCNASAIDVDAAGSIVGTAGPTPYLTVVRWTADGTAYTPEVLGTFAGSVEVDGMNAVGHFVGSYLDGVRKSFWWSQETGFLSLATPAALTSCYVADVNDSDQITGSCHGSGTYGNMQAVFWESPSATPEVLPSLAGYSNSSLGTALNNLAAIAGYTSTIVRNKVVYTTVRWVRSGATWTAQNLGALGGNPVPEAINDAGWIVGSDIVSGVRHAFAWSPGVGFKDLGVAGTESYAYSINNPAQADAIRIVGMSKRQGNFRAVVWTPQ
jgi:probable HAF family extracellular repeat protein